MNAWLSAIPALQVGLIKVAREDIGVCEEPLGSNRAPEIDAYLDRLGVPRANPWCAAALAAWADAAGVLRPAGAQACSCDAWMKWAKARGTWGDIPQPGYIVVYGKKEPLDAQHIGIILRVRPMLLSIEGNRGFGGATAEGLVVDMGPVKQAWVLGYIKPEPA